ncbi:flavin reductase [Carboxylicivirga sp. N1Y90]|uniref:flavin reductase n=1 Tax=Carboxylicivirga fragile TaxID=3417571 RepID=UPI003D333F4C|nr:nitroreductase family protein [Marinilabiliaceae bacterium N1Y90]
MQNKATLLNILLAIIIVVLVYQLSTGKSETPTPPKVHRAINYERDSISSEKKSIGPKGHIHPKPAVVIGSYGKDGKPNIMTAAWAGVVNSVPMSIGVSIRPSRLSYENIMATKAFTINVPSAQFVAHMDYAGNISGYDEDKFQKLGLTAVKGDFTNAPYIKEFPIVIECEVTETIDLGSHVQFIGKVIDTKVDLAYIDDENQIDMSMINPIIYGGEYYYGYGQRLGKPWDIGKRFKDDAYPTFEPKLYNNPTLATIHNRKSVRHFTSQQVNQQQLTELVRAGMAAPTAVNKQPWAFVAINERSKLDELSEILPYAKMLKQATGAIVVCGDMSRALDGVAKEYWIQDCSAATQNILLAAESMGLGAVWTGVHPISDREVLVKKVLKLPEHFTVLNVIPVGYPTGEDQPKDKWDENKLHWNTYTEIQ